MCTGLPATTPPSDPNTPATHVRVEGTTTTVENGPVRNATMLVIRPRWLDGHAEHKVMKHGQHAGTAHTHPHARRVRAMLLVASSHGHSLVAASGAQQPGIYVAAPVMMTPALTSGARPCDCQARTANQTPDPTSMLRHPPLPSCTHDAKNPRRVQNCPTAMLAGLTALRISGTNNKGFLTPAMLAQL